MKSPKIVAMYRLKNEERWIEKSLKATSEICSDIVVLDDDSTDRTLEICKKFSNVVDIHHQSNLPLDEARDRNVLLKLALKQNPDFIFTIDGDEIIQPNSKKILDEELNVIYPDKHVFDFQVLNIWDHPDQYKYEGFHGVSWTRRLVRIKDQPPDLQIQGTEFPHNLHCGGVPQNAIDWESPVRSKIKILHYGKYDEELRKKKYDFYTKMDPNNTQFDGYRRLLPDTKESSKEKNEFRKIPKGLYIRDIK